MEYKFPISLPRFSDDEMKAKKAAYVAEHGYYVSPPKLSDVIHVGFHKEPDDQEWNKFKSGDLRRNNPMRHSEISNLLDSKRARYRRMLASPAPTWLTNVGSVMTFMDDVNDFAGTAAVVCRIAARFAPRVLTRFFLGPAGWLLLIADLFSLMQSLWRLPVACFVGKRHFETIGDFNPFSKNAKARRARKLRRVLPGKGEIIEGLQVTDQLFGIGLCLGPLVGFAQDVVAGTVRTIRGERVHWRSPPVKPRSHEQNALRVLRFAQAVGLSSDEFTEEEHWLIYVCLNGATQVLKPYRDLWDPLELCDGLEHVLFEAPRPVYATTKFILEEFGVDPEANIGWPGLDKKEATAEQLWDFYQGQAADKFFDFCVRNRRNALGSTGAQNAFEFSKNMLLLTEGYETVDEEFGVAWKGWHDWYSSGCELRDCTTVAGGGCWNAKGHDVFIAGSWWHITGCAHPMSPPAKKYTDRCIPLRCGDCTVYFTPSMCPEGYREWVVSV